MDRRIRRRRRDYDESSSSEEEVSRSSTPRYILDKAGIFRWPPIKLEDSGGQIIKKVGRSFFAIKYQKVSNPDVSSLKIDKIRPKNSVPFPKEPTLPKL